MALTLDEIRHVAKLANLPLTSEEEDKYSQQLSKIIDYIDQLNNAETNNVEPTFNVTGLSNVMTEDETKESLSQKESTKNGSNTNDGYFVTKGVFEEE